MAFCKYCQGGLDEDSTICPNCGRDNAAEPEEKEVPEAEELQQTEAAEAAADDREKRLQKATRLLQAKYGKNAVLKGMNLSEGGTTKLRNEQIGGHKA